MKIQCPHCGVKGSADDSYHGKKVKCPKCQGLFAAIPTIVEVPQDHPVQAIAPVEKPVEPGVRINQALQGDLSDILPVEAGVENSQPTLEMRHQPVAEQEDVLDWQDIVSEIDKEMADGPQRGKDEEKQPAILPDFLKDTAPTGDDLDKPAVEQLDAAPAGNDTPIISATPLFTTQQAEQAEEKIALDGVENQPYGMDKEQCWQCGKKDSVGVPFIAKDGRLYCPECLPPEKVERDETGAISPGSVGESADHTESSPREPRYGFTIGGLLKEAWAKTKGVKATVWAGSAVMYLALIILGTCGAVFLPSQGNHGAGITMAGMFGDLLFPMIVDAVAVIFSAGLILIGIRKVVDDPIGWKMVFKGFPVAGKLIVATILQTILICIGFLLLILPGIYLTIGYAMTVPLIVDRKMSPWQAMEASRKAIHGEWWKIFGLFNVMSLIFMVAILPLGLGLIWIWPMFVVLGGVVYRSLFGIEKKVR